MSSNQVLGFVNPASLQSGPEGARTCLKCLALHKSEIAQWHRMVLSFHRLYCVSLCPAPFLSLCATVTSRPWTRRHELASCANSCSELPPFATTSLHLQPPHQKCRYFFVDFCHQQSLSIDVQLTRRFSRCFDVFSSSLPYSTLGLKPRKLNHAGVLAEDQQQCQRVASNACCICSMRCLASCRQPRRPQTNIFSTKVNWMLHTTNRSCIWYGLQRLGQLHRLVPGSWCEFKPSGQAWISEKDAAALGDMPTQN